MRRSLWILAGVLATAVLVAVVAYTVAGRVCAACLTSPTDDLAWLRLEFNLKPDELARIDALHRGYRPQCERHCARIAELKHALANELAAGAVDATTASNRLAEIAAVRTQCQTAMLDHFETVSRAMPREQGVRYLAVMRALTLGRHEEVEASMADCCEHGHGPSH